MVLPAEVAAKVASPLAAGGLDGLLGSDALSRFGTVTIDYATQVLHLGT